MGGVAVTTTHHPILTPACLQILLFEIYLWVLDEDIIEQNRPPPPARVSCWVVVSAPHRDKMLRFTSAGGGQGVCAYKYRHLINIPPQFRLYMMAPREMQIKFINTPPPPARIYQTLNILILLILILNLIFFKTLILVYSL